MSPTGRHGGLPADVAQGDPLVVLPGRSSEASSEGVLKALFQLASGPASDVAVGFLRRTPSYEVEWDAARGVARIGHDSQIFANHSTLRVDLTNKTLDET
jgi:hypothetical protein